MPYRLHRYTENMTTMVPRRYSSYLSVPVVRATRPHIIIMSPVRQR
jgi:hypothetical protein